MSGLVLHDTLARRKLPLSPLRPPEVSIYVCGVTVYDRAHIGHARVMVVFDLLVRWLKHLGLRPRYVRNFTDIDDKIIARAGETGEPIESLTARMIAAFREDMRRLGCLPPDAEPRATEHIPEMIRMIGRLVETGHAYVSEAGDVVYAVERFADYGRLSGKRLEELVAGARVEDHAGKRNPLDFVLWKRAKPGEPSWDSPWGPGRPGWHIECAAMSCHLLGETFDLHGGGMDLLFPHHENEIAEAAPVCGGFARRWMHVGFVTVGEEKMSKSLGNFWTIADACRRWHPEAVRLFALASHYRSPARFSEDAMAQAGRLVSRLYELWRRMGGRPEPGGLPAAFAAALNDDLNTPEALAVFWEHVREANRALDRGERAPGAARAVAAMGEVLGLGMGDPEDFFGDGIADEEVLKLIAEREEARRRRDFAAADRIRDELRARGIILEDTPEGTRWRRA